MFLRTSDSKDRFFWRHVFIKTSDSKGMCFWSEVFLTEVFLWIKPVITPVQGILWSGVQYFPKPRPSLYIRNRLIIIIAFEDNSLRTSQQYFHALRRQSCFLSTAFCLVYSQKFQIQISPYFMMSSCQTSFILIFPTLSFPATVIFVNITIKNHHVFFLV